MGGPAVHSILSVENFNLLSSGGQLQPVPGAGRLQDCRTIGLGYGPSSLPLQQNYLSGGVFSHCLTRRSDVQTFLRFGTDIPTPPGFLRVKRFVLFKEVPFYYENLLGISVHGQKLLIDPLVFAIRNQGTAGGCIMDNGASFTFLITPAFEALVQFLEMYFMRYPRLARAPGPRAPSFELCYKWTMPPAVEVQLPTLTFHFENADLGVQPSEAFITAKVDSQGNEAVFGVLARR
ncbi:aspartic proteinase nepenthesin-1 [Prunus persica]|uniref:aspartic proteinase nepenthesin-1 n=1 Tax=Prunus persica TaxID=3760 RepID=UPI0009AB69C0|nr:aspartic proteinase nepenthesin-1 [Prunus persica]